MSASKSSNIAPLSRLFQFLVEDKADLLALLIYTSISSLLNLSIPLAAQALINTIASGLFLQPLVILTGLILLGLSFNGLIRALEIYLVEIIQRRIFARVALRLARHIPNTTLDAFGKNYPPELVNRFFDTITAQKSIGKLFLDVPNAGLQGFLAFIFMGFYSPFLLGFDAVFIFMIICFWVLGIGAVKNSIAESAWKYSMAHWLEELARCHLNFKINAHSRFTLLKANKKVMGYLDARKKYFRIVFRQNIANFVFYALINAGVLALGGWLVLNNELTLGQLVAAELMTLILLNSADKIVSSLGSFYDLQTAMDKIGTLLDLPEEATGQMIFKVKPNAAVSVLCNHIHFKYAEGNPVFQELNLSIAPGSKVSIVGKSGCGKTTLALLMAGLYHPDFGNVTINGFDLRNVDLHSFRAHLSLVTNSNDLFEGTLEENIRLSREKISQEDLLWALDMVDLTQELSRLDNGLQTGIISEGKNLSEGVRQRVLLARALVTRPALLILDEVFHSIGEVSKSHILDRLMEPEAPWTVIHLTHDLDVIARSQQVFTLHDGAIQEMEDPWVLASQADSYFSQTFPKLAMILCRTPRALFSHSIDKGLL
jgi:ABC-type bacteriocin/lantibiotic exporter with double-glycine peptidase domain